MLVGAYLQMVHRQLSAESASGAVSGCTVAMRWIAVVTFLHSQLLCSVGSSSTVATQAVHKDANCTTGKLLLLLLYYGCTALCEAPQFNADCYTVQCIAMRTVVVQSSLDFSPLCSFDFSPLCSAEQF